MALDREPSASLIGQALVINDQVVPQIRFSEALALRLPLPVILGDAGRDKEARLP